MNLSYNGTDFDLVYQTKTFWCGTLENIAHQNSPLIPLLGVVSSGNKRCRQLDCDPIFEFIKNVLL